MKFQQYQRARVRRVVLAMTALCTASLFALAMVSHDGASATHYPTNAEAILLLDGTQTAPPDGFNMQIDDNGFSNAGGGQSFTHMFCVQSTVHYRCGVGANDLLRVQGPIAATGLSTSQANEIAWILTNHSGYDLQEMQLAIWCVSNPGVNPPFANSAQLCADAKSFAVPDTAQLSLAVSGTAQVAEGVAVHFLVATDAPTVDLSVSDGGTNAVLCGTAPGNASAAIVGAQLQQSRPATQRTFELCLTRSNVATGSIAATLTASLGATVENLQAWVHPTAPQTCQGLVDTALTTQRRAVHAAGTWTNVDGSLTVTKTVVGDAPANSTFDIAIHGPNSLVQAHTFPDAVGDPWSHTFTDLPAGNYTVTETATGGATHVVVAPNATTLVGADLSPTVTVTNSFVGQLKLTKRTDIPTGKTFGFDISCTYQSVNVNAWTNPIRLSANQSFTSPEVPAGTKCSITESDTGAAISTLIQLDSLGVQSQSVGTQASGIAIANGTTVSVEFLNTMALGSTIASTSTTGAPRNTTIASTSTTIDDTVNPLGSTTSNGRTPNDTHNLATSGTDADQLFTVGGFTLLSGVAILFGTRRRRNLKRPSK